MFRICIIDDDKIHTEKTRDILNEILKTKQQEYIIDEYNSIDDINILIESIKEVLVG